MTIPLGQVITDDHIMMDFLRYGYVMDETREETILQPPNE